MHSKLKTSKEFRTFTLNSEPPQNGSFTNQGSTGEPTNVCPSGLCPLGKSPQKGAMWTPDGCSGNPWGRLSRSVCSQRSPGLGLSSNGHPKRMHIVCRGSSKRRIAISAELLTQIQVRLFWVCVRSSVFS